MSDFMKGFLTGGGVLAALVVVGLMTRLIGGR